MTSQVVRAATNKEQAQLRVNTPWTPDLSYCAWMDKLGAQTIPLIGRVVTGGKIHRIMAQVIERNGEMVVVGGSHPCGTYTKWNNYLQLSEIGQRCGKCF